MALRMTWASVCSVPELLWLLAPSGGVALSRASGTAAGTAAGVPVVGMLTSQTAERLTKAGAVRCVRNYKELLALADGAHGAELAAG